MTTDLPPTPTTWAELYARHTASPEADARGFDYFYPSVARGGLESGLFPVPFESCVEVIANTMLYGSVAVAARQLATLDPLIGEIAEAPLERPILPRARRAALVSIVLAELLEVPLSVGAEIAPRVLPSLLEAPRSRRKTKGAATSEPSDQRKSIWAFLAFGVTERLTDPKVGLLVADLGPPPTDIGAAFGPNVQAAQVQIARALVHRAPFRAVAPTWDSYRGHTPRLMAAKQGALSELCCAARACCGVIGEQRPTEVLQHLRSSCR